MKKVSNKPGPGRPPKESQLPPPISIRLEPSLAESCKLAARLEGVTFPDWIRAAMAERYDRQAQEGLRVKLKPRRKTKTTKTKGMPDNQDK